MADPCDAATAADVIFDASLSKDPSGRPLSKVRWSQAGDDFVLAAALDKANTAKSYRC